jgi:hypothetical protein
VRIVVLPRGRYRLIVAQRREDEEVESVLLRFVPAAPDDVSTSRILLADAALSPPEPLVEHARIEDLSR